MEFKNFNCMFNIIGEEVFKVNYFIKSDIEDVYLIFEKVCIVIFEVEFDEVVV